MTTTRRPLGGGGLRGGGDPEPVDRLPVARNRNARPRPKPAFPGGQPDLRSVEQAFTVVDGWWEYQRLRHGSPEERKALEAGHPARACESWNEVRRRMNRGGVAGLDLVVALLSRAHRNEDIALVGTGPLEDLVRKHGNVICDHIVELALRNEKFAQALSNVIARHVLNWDTARRLSPWVL